MKKYLSFIVFGLFCCMLTIVSCTKESDGNDVIKPFAKKVEMVIHAAVDDAKAKSSSRGFLPGYDDFDSVYDPLSVFLHIVGSDASVELPLTTKTCSGEECRCFSYYYELFEDGSAKITPYLVNGQLASTSLDIPANSKLYFSSIPEAVWELPEGSVVEQTVPGYEYTYYQRGAVNKEVYRSIEEYSTEQMAGEIESVIMGRGCASFTLFSVLYDGDEMNKKPNGGYISLTGSEFSKIMGSDPSTWYIKLFIGGPAFTDKYDMGEMKSVGVNPNGFYTTGDYIPLNEMEYGNNKYWFGGFGYLTLNGNQLLVPTTGGEVEIYVFIKHWEGEGNPDTEWLESDKEALYTQIKLDAESHPRNNNFYTYGLFMNIVQFQKAWANKGVEPTSRSFNGVYYFSSEDAITVCERR